MKLSKNYLAFDLVLQSLIIGFALIAVLFSVFSPSNLTFYMLCQIDFYSEF